MKPENINTLDALVASHTKDLGRRAILVMSDCSATPALATIISGYLASIGVRHGYISLDRTAEAVADSFKRFGFSQNLDLIELWEPIEEVSNIRIQEVVESRQWNAVIIDNINILGRLCQQNQCDLCLMLDRLARSAGVPVFCIANKPHETVDGSGK